MERVELCCHTNMSRLQGIDTVKDYIDEAIKRGYKQIAITDKDSTQSFIKANSYLNLYHRNEDFKIIYGCELTFKNEKKFSQCYSIFIYVKEQKGLKNLYKLVSLAYRNMIQGQPLVYREDLDKYRDGLLYASIGNNSEVYKNIDKKNISKIMVYYDFIGIEQTQKRLEININKKINNLCNKNNKVLVGSSMCNFINKEDYICNEILNMYKESNEIERGNNNYLHTADELIVQFNYIENAKKIVIDNPSKIAEQIEDITPVPVKAKLPKISFSDMIISKKCYDKAHEIYGEKLPENVDKRLKLELHSIIENNFQNIYFIYSELFEYSKKIGYKAVCTASKAGCSLVAYLLGITEIDPIKYNLPFEIFATKNYDMLPDIEMSVSSEIREEIFKYLREKYGESNVIFCNSEEYSNVDNISKVVDEYVELTEIEDLNDREYVIKKLKNVKQEVSGLASPAVILVGDGEIYDFCPTEIWYKNQVVTHLDRDSIMDLGFYTFNIRCSNVSTLIHNLESLTNTNSDNINFDDEDSLNVFRNAFDTSFGISINGIPRFEEEDVKKIIEKSKPQTLNDFACVLALAEGTGAWEGNAENRIKEGKKLTEVLSNREDMYNYLIESGIDINTAYDIVTFVRKGKASKGRLWKLDKDRYVEYVNKWSKYKEIMKNYNIPEWYIKSAESIDYLFTKSWALERTITAIKIAWYKVHYPEVFYKEYFKVISNLQLKDYYCKRQVQTKINRLYDEEELERAKKYKKNYTPYKKREIRELELVLEMFDREILKEKY